jgi:hypothetical protein
METQEMIRWAFKEESMSHILKVQTHRDRWRAKSRACSSFPLTSRRLVHREFVLVVQTVNSTCYCDILRRVRENVGRLRWQNNWLSHRDNAPFHQGIFDQKQHDCLLYNAILQLILWLITISTDPEARVRFPALPEKKSSGSGTGSTQPREYNWGATW